MIVKGKQRIKSHKNKGDLTRFKELKGYLTDKQARNSLIDFLLSNLRILVDLMFNIRLYQVQVLMLKMMFSRDRCLFILPRGFSKSWTTALFCCLYAMIYPNSKIGITAVTFRASREIIGKIEEFKKKKGADLFRNCVDEKSIKHATDYWSIDIGSSKVIALPLGEKIRGYRFNVVIVDELLLISQEFINTVVIPFLSTNTDPLRQQEIREEEDRLIKVGLLIRDGHFL